MSVYFFKNPQNLNFQKLRLLCAVENNEHTQHYTYFNDVIMYKFQFTIGLNTGSYNIDFILYFFLHTVS